jgi:two-component system, NtrC family, sensor kinase
MDITESAITLQRLTKENRILKKKLERSELDCVRSESIRQKKEALLKTVIAEIQDSRAVLEKKSSDLEKAFNELTLMRDKLVEAEKMAALATLVAGIAHEINTPVGTSITLASTLADETKALGTAVAQGQLKRTDFNNYLEIAIESTALLMANLTRAGELIQSFKQVAVDQVILEHRTFSVKDYLEEVVNSLALHFKKTPLTLNVEGDASIHIDSYPGAIAQVATNLVTNSLTHAFQAGTHGHIRFDVAQYQDAVLIEYSDDGCGIPPENLGKIFDPFFTTAYHQGGTGLGLHIVYNLVTQKLHGRIDVQSAVNQGTQFKILLPLSIKP